MRAWLEAREDKSLPSLIGDAAGAVVAAFKGILKILTGNHRDKAESCGIRHYQSTCEKWRLARVWQGNAGAGPWNRLTLERQT